MPPRPAWKRWVVPAVVSERHAIRALVAGFVMEAATEVYQLATSVGSIRSQPVGYYTSLAITVLGFYFLWRGSREWAQLHPRIPRDRPRSFPRATAAMFAAGIVATALLNVGLGSVGDGGTPAPLAWVVSGGLVAAVGSFFLTLRRNAAPLQGTAGQVVGWTAFAWSLGISTVSGLALGQAIVALFIDFFTNWPALFLRLAPFIFQISPLFVAFTLISIAYAEAYRGATGP